jgi:multidrug efflux pump
MIISAINAMTLTPARAVTTFKTEEGHDGHEHQREALPWWIFGILGGVLTYAYGYALIAGPLGLPVTEEDKAISRLGVGAAFRGRHGQIQSHGPRR